MDKRKRRVKRIKIILIVLFILFLLLPSILCGILFMKVNKLSDEIEELRVLRAMKVLAAEQEMDETSGAGDRKPASEEEKEADENESDTPETALKETVGWTEDETDRKEQTGKKPEQNEPVKKVYLTFDDGPGQNTEEILAVLNEYHVKATFFVVGKEDDYSREMYRRIVEEGHTLAMHSYSHEYGTIYESLEEFQKDYEKISSLLADATGVKPTVYRFPGGSSNLISEDNIGVFITYLNEQGIAYYDWNVSSGDAASRPLSAEKICENVLTGTARYQTSVVLMHDLAEKDTTVEALPAIIEGLWEQGAEICPIDAYTTPVQHVKLSDVVEGLQQPSED